MNFRQITGHTAFWIILMLTYAFSEWGYRDNFQQAILFELIYLPVRLIAVYVNWFVFIPLFLYHNKIARYLLSLILLLILLAAVQQFMVIYWAYPKFFPQWDLSGRSPLEPFRVVQSMTIITAPVAFSTIIKLFVDWYDQKTKVKQLAIEKRETELKYLKSQINSHFLFNTLNNMYGLSIEKSDKLPGLILKLSDLLSYSLYESQTEKILVRKEIKLIKDFIELETDRYQDRVNITWSIDNSSLDRQIASLIYMPLVENAFKHGVREEIATTYIKIQLFEEDGWLIFKVGNTIPELYPTKESPGIGLENLRRRLQLTYPDKHQLTTSIVHNEYLAILKLQINE